MQIENQIEAKLRFFIGELESDMARCQRRIKQYPEQIESVAMWSVEYLQAKKLIGCLTELLSDSVVSSVAGDSEMESEPA
jgi:hypothetical protein